MPSVILKPGHVQPVWSGHPWVYAQAVARVEGGATAGDEVSVLDPRGNLLGRGLYSPRSAIVVRIATRNRDTRLDVAWLRRRLSTAHELRHGIGLPTARTNAYRMVHAEGDGVPGLIIDRFNDVAAMQLTTVGMQRRRSAVLDAIDGVYGIKTVVDRTPATYANAEGFTPEPGIARGDPKLDAYRFQERGFTYEIPLELGQKTGYYFDQRPLRGRIEQLARGRRVLDAYCFVGSFALAAARGGATSVLAVDENVVGLDTGAACARTNGFGDRITFTRGSVRDILTSEARGRGFDLVILDPPSLAPSNRSSDRAKQAFRRIATAGCRAVRPGGLLVLSACSAAVGLEALTRAVALGARDASTHATVLERWFQGADHPVPAAFSEGLYLKSVIVRIEPR